MFYQFIFNVQYEKQLSIFLTCTVMAKPNCMGIAMFCKPFSHINTLHFSGWYRAEIEDNKSQQQQAVCYQKFLLIAKENNSKLTDVHL